MVWYYAEGDRQRGPISDEEFQELVNNGRIRDETLIWTDGMENWVSLDNAMKAGLTPQVSPAILPGANAGAGSTEFGNADPGVSSAYPKSGGTHNHYGGASAPGALPAAEAAAGTPRCVQCGTGPLRPGDAIQLGNLLLCHRCDADLARHYRQAESLQGGAAPAAGKPNSWSSYVAGYAQAGQLALASIITRAAAKIIDNLIGSVLLAIVMAITADVNSMGINLQDVLHGSEQLLLIMRPYLLAMLAFRALYDAILIGMFGATLGKMALGIHIVSADGTKVSANQAVIRALVPAILQVPAVLLPVSALGSITQFIFIFGYVIAVMDPQKRTLYDHLANTRVVK